MKGWGYAPFLRLDAMKYFMGGVSGYFSYSNSKKLFLLKGIVLGEFVAKLFRE